MIPTSSYEFIRELVYTQLQIPVYTQTSYANSNVSLPCIIFARNNTDTIMYMNATAVYTDGISFAIKAKTIEKVEEYRDFLIGLLDGYDYQISLQSETNDFDIDTAIYTRDVFFNVIYKL